MNSEDPNLPSVDHSEAGGRKQQTGIVIRYLDDKGYGFVEVEGKLQIFFHIRDCVSSRLYVGERVSFLVRKDNDGKDRALEVRRLGGEFSTGDIVKWHVDPGNWRAEGQICPSDGGPPLRFSTHDLAKPKSPGARPTHPRPWHAARYRLIVRAEGTQQPVDIEIDWRYPLQRFAYLGEEDAWVSALKRMTLNEDWDYRSSKSRKPNEILYNYLHFTFARLVDEDRGKDLLDRKIRLKSEIAVHEALAAFNTGLVDHRYESIFALFEKNDPGRQQPWKFLAFCTPGEDAGKLLSRYFNPLPGPAKYFTHVSELLYDPDAPLHPDYNHILTENRDRLPQELIRLIGQMEPARAENTLKMHIDRAIELARKRARWNFKTAIPHYFPTLQRLDFLLPLCLLDDSTVDVALAVQRTETGYIGSTILPLDWAYKSARLVCRPDSDWLAPRNIDAGEDLTLT